MQPIAGKYYPGSMRRRSPGLSSLALVLAIITVCNCAIAVADAADSVGTVQSTGVNMSDAAHSNKADPNYSVVFPDDQVNTMTITISPGNWQVMLENMTEMYGEFGGGSTARSAGQAAERDMNPGGGEGMDMWSDTDPVYVPADITFEGADWPDVGIRFKGFNSLQGAWNEGSYKISLKLNFDKYEDEYPEIKNQRFYGFDELNLQGNYNDDSLMRDMVVPSIFRESGVAAPFTAFYRLYIDYGEGPVYFGLYTMVEAVEDTVIETQFGDDSGNLYKPEGTGATFAEDTFDKNSFEKKTNEDEADYSDVEALYTILNSDTRLTDPEQWRAELESVFDVDVFLRWLATNTVIQNWDTYGGNCRNFYLYTDPADGKITWIPWDNNYALNGGMGGGGQAPAMSAVEVEAAETATPMTMMTANETWQSGLSAHGNSNVQAMNGFARDNTRQFSRNFTGGSPLDMGEGNRAPGDMGGGNRTPGNTPPGNMTPGDGGNVPGGGMGSTLSLGLEEVGDNWPLIRYLADDPVYYAQYQEYLEMVVTTSFEPEKMEETYRYYHSLIEPYVTGAEGERAECTHLNSPEDFDTALDELITHVNSRYEAVMEFLSITPVVTPTPTPGAVKDTNSPRVSMTSPVSYSSVTPGQDVVITWSATDDVGVEEVAISYSMNRGLTWTGIADDLPDEGTYIWTVPENSSTLLTIRVSAEDAAGNTGSASRTCRVSSTVTFSAGRTFNITAIKDSITIPSALRDRISSGKSSPNPGNIDVTTVPSISAGTLASVRNSSVALTPDTSQAGVFEYGGSASHVVPDSHPAFPQSLKKTSVTTLSGREGLSRNTP